MLGTFVTTAILALASTSAAPPNHHRHAVNHRHGCQTRACDKRADAAYARHQRRKRTAELARGWAIPEAIVMCESKGKNLPPNSASAAGYYQVTAGTWPEGGGRPPNDASQHSKAEQDSVAARLWDGGRGASRWVCKA